MSQTSHARRLNLLAFAQAGAPLSAHTPVQELDRLLQELHAPGSDLSVTWKATPSVQPGAGGADAQDVVWLRLQATATVPLVCQRCMGAVHTALVVDQQYRFVASEEIAMAEDDDAEEDLLVMEPQFDVLAVLEDELLMAVPLVPMHDECPEAPKLQVGEDELLPMLEEKPHPFAALAQLNTKK